MRWLEPEPDVSMPPAVAFSLLRQAIEKDPDNPVLQTRLGAALLSRSRYGDAVDAFEIAARQVPDDFHAWPKLAKCYVEIDRPDAALDACRRAEIRQPSAELHFQKGRALLKLQRPAAARDAFLAAVKSGAPHFSALRALLTPLARQPDGAELRDFCDALPQPCRHTALVRAHRAIALSRLGRTQEALQIVDLDRYVARVSFVPPAQFGAIDQFNRRLADDILADRDPNEPAGEGFDFNPAPQFHRSETFVALREFIKSAIDDFLDEARARGFDAVMPPPPAEGSLYQSSTVLRGPGHNGEHVHGNAYISTVYHVLVPESVSRADDDRGALALGRCESHTGGYTPCWGTRYIRPEAGSLVMFPSHIFHDVVPSRTQAPRIAVAADLQPATRGSVHG
ncbi:MAG TPA: putative 2OG-Fe(II) oxygenase [Xanthobacteraceae bacterium]|nr:putative 2OG-Fe(II) oxygenase [Xanthobacteraceae bacterium]